MTDNQVQTSQLFEQYYQKYYLQSLRYVHKRIQNLHDAEDLVGDSFLYCYEHYTEYDPNKASFATWLYLVVNSRIKNYYRDRKETVELDSVSELLRTLSADSVEQAIELSRLRELLYQALNNLTETQRQIVIMKYFHNYSSKKIAERTGVSEGNVRVILSRALFRLRSILNTQE